MADFEHMPADVLRNIALALAGEKVSTKDKLNNAKQIVQMCQINKRFKQIYCDNEEIWKQLYQRDIGTPVPQQNIKNDYITLLELKVNPDKFSIEELRELSNSGNLHIVNASRKVRQNKYSYGIDRLPSDVRATIGRYM
jgi:hypothetical protein